MENRPLSPHIQIYKWHISSLVSISHRITGIINFFAITLICIWFTLMLLGESNYQIIKIFLETFLGKFILIGLFLVIAYFFSALTISEVFEDYINDKKTKNAANKVLNFFAITIPVITIIVILNLNT